MMLLAVMPSIGDTRCRAGSAWQRSLPLASKSCVKPSVSAAALLAGSHLLAGEPGDLNVFNQPGSGLDYICAGCGRVAWLEVMGVSPEFPGVAWLAHWYVVLRWLIRFMELLGPHPGVVCTQSSTV
jgi:hypothetical protein